MMRKVLVFRKFIDHNNETVKNIGFYNLEKHDNRTHLSFIHGLGNGYAKEDHLKIKEYAKINWNGDIKSIEFVHTDNFDDKEILERLEKELNKDGE